MISGSALLRQFLDEVTLMTDIEPDDKGQADAVRLMTIHASKGLEFEHVYIVGTEENVFPMSRAKMDPAEMEEERRLMYVAITRAKDVLFISHAHTRMQRGQTMYNAPSRFIEEIPQDLIQEYQLGNTHNRIQVHMDIGDLVKHKLRGSGEIIEIRDDLAVVSFDNHKFGYRKVPLTMLDLL